METRKEDQDKSHPDSHAVLQHRALNLQTIEGAQVCVFLDFRLQKTSLERIIKNY